MSERAVGPAVSYTIRGFQERDYKAIADIESAIGPEIKTEPEIREWVGATRTNPDYRLTWYGADDGDGALVGFAQYGRVSWLAPHQRHVYVAVAPRSRGVGVASLLYERLLAEAHAERAKSMVAWCRGYDSRSLQWARQRGFVVTRERTESVLDLSGWDSSAFADRVDRARASGVEMKIVDGEGAGAYLSDLYQLFIETMVDLPFLPEGVPAPSYEAWLHDVMGSHAQKVFALAINGGHAVGESSVYLPRTEGQSALVGYTAVLKRFRGRGIAFALKVLATEATARAGAQRIRTNNDTDNPAILTINAGLGFRLVPGPQIVEKVL